MASEFPTILGDSLVLLRFPVRGFVLVWWSIEKWDGVPTEAAARFSWTGLGLSSTGLAVVNERKVVRVRAERARQVEVYIALALA